MQTKIIILRSKAFDDGIHIELPGDHPITELIPEILRVLHWPEKSKNIELSYDLLIDNQVLNQSLSLDQIGIENFQTIWITPPKMENANTAELQGKEIPPQIDIALPFWENIPINEPCLISMKGTVFPLRKPSTLIGRHDDRNRVDIDLTDLEKYLFISSRKHAEIMKVDQGFILRPYHTTNGTFLNGVELTADVIYPLKNGNIIQFGFWGVQLVFKLPV